VDSVLIEKALDQQNRSDRDEYVFPEEESDVVDSSGVRSKFCSELIWAARRTDSLPLLQPSARSAAHHLRVPAEGGETERGCDLTDGEVGKQNTRASRATQSRHDGTRPFLEPGVFEQANDGNTSHTIATYRLVMNAFPNAATTASGPRPLAMPVASPATVTTRSGFIRRTNPMTTMTIPIRVSMAIGRNDLQNRDRN